MKNNMVCFYALFDGGIHNIINIVALVHLHMYVSHLACPTSPGHWMVLSQTFTDDQ